RQPSLDPMEDLKKDIQVQRALDVIKTMRIIEQQRPGQNPQGQGRPQEWRRAHQGRCEAGGPGTRLHRPCFLCRPRDGVKGRRMIVLGIESSCDETAAAVLADGRQMLSNVVASPDAVHAPYGGVVPELASRRHLEVIVPVVEKALADSGVRLPDLDAIAVTQGPGLVGSLLVGCAVAKSLAYVHRLPLVPVNHLEGHIYAAFLTDDPPAHPFLALVGSGGGTALSQP